VVGKAEGMLVGSTSSMPVPTAVTGPTLNLPTSRERVLRAASSFFFFLSAF
jgi:hypothetical protein